MSTDCLPLSPLSIAACDTCEGVMAETITTKLARLEERIDNHIKFFWVVVAFQFACLGGLLWLGLQSKSSINTIAKTEANAPAQIVASILSSRPSSPTEAAASLDAASAIFKTAKVGKTRPDASKLKNVAEQLTNAQNAFPDLPQVWNTTGAFIGYKFQALLPTAAKVREQVGGTACTTAIQLPGSLRFENCEVSLEDLARRFHRNTQNNHPAPFELVNCIVRYSGGALPDAPITFRNSLFIFEITAVPPRNAERLMNELARTDHIEQVSFSS